MDTPYENLANAIILQAVKDYRLHDDERELACIERFFRSGWFSVLTSVDPESLITKLREEKVRYDYDDPFAQAAYAYSLIESEVQTIGDK